MVIVSLAGGVWCWAVLSQTTTTHPGCSSAFCSQICCLRVRACPSPEVAPHCPTTEVQCLSCGEGIIPWDTLLTHVKPRIKSPLSFGEPHRPSSLQRLPQIISLQAPTAGAVCAVCAALPQAAQHCSRCLHPAQAALFPCPQTAFNLPGGAGSSPSNVSYVLLLQCPPASLKHPLPPEARFLQSPEHGGHRLQLLQGHDQGHPHSFQSWTLPA